MASKSREQSTGQWRGGEGAARGEWGAWRSGYAGSEGQLLWETVVFDQLHQIDGVKNRVQHWPLRHTTRQTDY